MCQLFEVPDAATEDRMRRALDALQSVARIGERAQAASDALTGIRQAVTEERYAEAFQGLAAVIQQAGLQDEDTVKDLLDFTSAGQIANPVPQVVGIMNAG